MKYIKTFEILRNLIKESLKLQYDSANDKLIVLSDKEGKEASKETFYNKNILKNNGFTWNGTHWVIDSDKLEDAKKTLSIINKTEYIVNSLEELEEMVDNSNLDKKELLKQKIDLYIQDLANITDEKSLSAEIRRFLTFYANFHQYSYYNRMLIWIQNPKAEKVASYKKWQEKFRQVKQGAKGISILAPIIDNKDKKETDNDINISNVKGYKAVNVFDITDTFPIDERGEAPDEPNWFDNNTPSETADELFGYLTEILDDMNIQLTNKQSGYGEKGYAAGDHINLSSDISGVGRLATMVHEIAHELMHFKQSSIYYQGDEVKQSKELKELQAESVSYVVLKHYDLPTEHHSTYLALWKANKERISKNLEVISKVAQFIINQIDKKAEK